ncbi:MAG TPA: hypothetical protein VER96_26280 [Polyangiaceae bacterium]|nr:hypothetical protein [Polyangiaceae bacterium]
MDLSVVAGRWFRVSGAVVIGAGVLMGACSSDGTKAGMSGAGGSGTTAESVMDLDGILAAEGRGYCARLFRCAEGNDDFVGARLILKTAAACEALMVDVNAKAASIRDLRVQLSSGALRIVPAKAQACLDELAACNGTDSLTRGSCRDMFEGQVAEGSSCQRSEDCAGDAYCAVGAQCPGTCRARSASGEACQSGDECAAGNGYTFCDHGATSGGVCRTVPLAPKATLGQPCTRELVDIDTLSLCVDSLWCGHVAGADASAALGTCQEPIALGGACTDEDDMCAEGMCDPSTHVCRTFNLLEHAGEACDKAQFKICNPRLGLWCNDQGVCEATGDHTQGSLCSNGDYQLTCNSGLYCRSKTATEKATCQPLLKAGASCDQASSCESGICDGQTCQPRPCTR